jgi:SlyX protein
MRKRLDKLDSPIIELQSRLAWQEDLLESLNLTVASQQRKLDQLEKLCRELIDRYRQLSETVEARQITDSRPPHY